MNAGTRPLGQAVAAVAVVTALLLGGLSTQDAAAKPNKDTRPMPVKILELKEGCEATGGSFGSTNPPADPKSTYTWCEGGGKPTVSCVLTTTTGECFAPPTREAPSAGGPEASDGTDLGATGSTSGGKKGGPEGKKGDKGRN